MNDHLKQADKKEYQVGVFDLEDKQVLVEVFPDGQMHIAFRENPWETWSPGAWAIYKTARLG